MVWCILSNRNFRRNEFNNEIFLEIQSFHFIRAKGNHRLQDCKRGSNQANGAFAKFLGHFFWSECSLDVWIGHKRTARIVLPSRKVSRAGTNGLLRGSSCAGLMAFKNDALGFNNFNDFFDFSESDECRDLLGLLTLDA